MVTLEPEDSQPAAPPAPRPVYFSPKSYAAMVSTWAVLLAGAVFVLSLMYYPKSDGEKLRSDYDNHAKVAEERDIAVDAELDTAFDQQTEQKTAVEDVADDVKTIKCLLTAKGHRAKNQCLLED